MMDINQQQMITDNGGYNLTPPTMINQHAGR